VELVTGGTCLDSSKLVFSEFSSINYRVVKCYGSPNCRSDAEINQALAGGVLMVPIQQANFVDNNDFAEPVKSKA
jgi:hypothetical protein